VDDAAASLGRQHGRVTAGPYAAASGLIERLAGAFAHAVPADPRDDGFFGPASLTWQVNADLSAPVAGLRALLLQALHPLVMAGVDQHSSWRLDPAGRLAATSGYVAAISYGDRDTARRAAQRVRAVHQHVHGTDTVTGQRYAAGDPALLLWVHAAVVDSALAALGLFGTPLPPSGADQYASEMTVAAELAGVPRGMIPQDVAALQRYMTAVRPQLRRTPAAAEVMAWLLGPPGMEEELAELWQDIAGAAVTALPDWARDMYGYAPAAELTPGRRTEIRQALGVLDAAILGEPGTLQARQRLALRVRPTTPVRPHRRAASAALGGASATARAVLHPGAARLRAERGAAALLLVARGGARYASHAPRLFAAAGEHRARLRNDLALQTAEDVAATLGTMKGVLMKLGQMASYINEGLTPAARRTLSRLQDSARPMSPDLAAQVIAEELGLPPDRAFAAWDPEPIAAASIGQVHRAIIHNGRAVAVKVQYPGIAEAIEADLGNVALLRRMLRVIAPSQDADALLAELRDRITQELDYRAEARSQQLFARFYAGHPTIHVPGVVGQLSARRVLTSELAGGARFAELAGWPQAERDLAAETIYRFVFRSLYQAHIFNGDPHPGNYLFDGGGKVTFLDFGLVKRFTADELRPLVDMVRCLCVDHDPEAFRRANEDAGVLLPGAPVSTQTVVEQMAIFYDTVREPGPRTMTGQYAAAVASRFVDLRSPLAAYVQLPQSYLILQRINLGLYALLGDLSATADWRRIAEEIWPFMHSPPSTPIGTAEAAWRAGKR